jgi:hypothetical protein
MKSISNLLILLFILLVLGILYRRFEDKREREEIIDIYENIQQYLLDDDTLGKSKKPILWIHVPYEYNSRRWLSFGSRSSFDLNQPYLYLTVRSIIKCCDESFTICIIDDSSFKKLIPGWNINMTSISDPILSKMRMLGLTKLLYMYGGLQCPLSFVCIKDLLPLYTKGIRGDKMFVCETIDRNSSSVDYDFFPNLKFCGAPKECETVRELCEHIQTTISNDYTAESKFLGDFNRWCAQKIESGKMNMIEGVEIGTKTVSEKQIILDDLMSNQYLDLYQGAYGILIPSDEILNRRKYEWFARLSQQQVLDSDTIIGNYILLSVAPGEQGAMSTIKPLEPLINKKVEDKFVGFWRIPSDAPYWGLKPSGLGDNLQMIPYAER